jgi:hypothetical protein
MDERRQTDEGNKAGDEATATAKAPLLVGEGLG